ncbi:homoserine dehydrogenase [Oscillochloris sp. ZM17-4]|uniref:homoserine dehydrogenase n=1 Tax=Oscillochloris sp. ZM17-4 TaxID=2866714 RepID=UPI001C73CE71|nr:homoserine dehydrogenase [Oscillochloris sp. ZM17-4]MBX0326594.1 homoserine dehydrogenase [Oscillochloris sp. ZM17-4]
MKTISIVQIGVGGVGRELVTQLLAARGALAARYGFRLEYLALADSAGALVSGTPLPEAAIQAAMRAKGAGDSLAASPAGRAIQSWEALLPEGPCVVVDVTAASGHEGPLARAVAAGHRVVLANKKPLSAAWADFVALTAGGATRYETTAGAGLPVVSTLQGLLDSGDALTKIEAAMSGTLGYLCAELEAGVPLSTAVRAAHRLGYTEPDPRDDLSGADVARKALILARTCGLPWELADIPAEPWFSPDLAAVGRDVFMGRLEELDELFAARVAAARAEGAALRYVATVTPGRASVGLKMVPATHPLASLRGPDNLFSFTTARYAAQPLVVRGPGAGQEVTAAGVLADIVATARTVGA